MIRERYYDGIEDDKYDEARQRVLDALMEGREAGVKGLSVEMNPFYDFEPEHAEWLRGRMETLGSQQRRVA